MYDYFLLFDCCRIVAGHKNFILCDLQRSAFFSVPEELAPVLKEIKKVGISAYLSTLVKEDQDVVQEYLSFLKDEELGFYCSSNNLNNFLAIDESSQHFGSITNAVISFVNKSSFIQVTNLLIDLGCQHFVIEISSLNSVDSIGFLEQYLQMTPIKSIRIKIEHFNANFEQLAHMARNCIVLEQIEIFNSRQSRLVEKLRFIKGAMTMYQAKSRDSLISNLQLFFESQKHNTYFNKKLFVGFDGKIKNAKECETSFGSMTSFESPETISAIINNPEFQKYWNSHKEVIDVCCDCEFRYMCVDKRVPNQRENGNWYFSQECEYNPYVGKWKGENGYCNLAESGVMCNDKELKIDHEILLEVNKELWRE